MPRSLALVKPQAVRHSPPPPATRARKSYVVKIGPRRKGVVGAVVSKADVERLQKALASEAGTLGQVVSSNVVKLDENTLNAWHDFFNRAMSFAGETAPTFFTASAMDAGQALERELQAWYPRLQQAGLQVGPAPAPPPAETPGLLGSLGDLTKALPLVVVFLIFREMKGFKI